MMFRGTESRRADAIAYADELVERDGWFSASVVNDKQHQLHYRSQEDMPCEVDGDTIGLQPGRTYLKVRKIGDERTFREPTDATMHELAGRFRSQQFTIVHELTLRETAIILHEEAIRWSGGEGYNPPF